jgi:hypothetical protein
MNPSRQEGFSMLKAARHERAQFACGKNEPGHSLPTALLKIAGFVMRRIEAV